MVQEYNIVKQEIENKKSIQHKSTYRLAKNVPYKKKEKYTISIVNQCMYITKYAI